MKQLMGPVFDYPDYTICNIHYFLTSKDLGIFNFSQVIQNINVMTEPVHLAVQLDARNQVLLSLAEIRSLQNITLDFML